MFKIADCHFNNLKMHLSVIILQWFERKTGTVWGNVNWETFASVFILWSRNGCACANVIQYKANAWMTFHFAWYQWWLIWPAYQSVYCTFSTCSMPPTACTVRYHVCNVHVAFIGLPCIARCALPLCNNKITTDEQTKHLYCQSNVLSS